MNRKITLQIKKNLTNTQRVIEAIYPAFTDNNTAAVHCVDLSSRLSPSQIGHLALRIQRLSQADTNHLNTMKKQGADPWQLLQFIAAPQDCPMDDTPGRDEVYANFQKRSAELSWQRKKARTLKLAVPAVLASVVACAGAALVLGGGAIATSLAGADPNLVQSFEHGAQYWQDKMKPIASYIFDCGLDDWIGRGVMFAFAMHFLRPNKSFEDLKKIAMEEETPLLAQALGPSSEANRIAIHRAIRAIPEHERVLLAHLSGVELRHFLLGQDTVRRDILKRNPPLMANDIQALLNTPQESGKMVHAYRVLGQLSNALLPSALRERGWFGSSEQTLDARLERWCTQPVGLRGTAHAGGL